MTFSATFLTLGRSAFSQTAGDLFLAQSLAPTHLDPIVAVDPSRSCFLRVDNGDDGGSGDDDILEGSGQAAVLSLLRSWPSRRSLVELRRMKEPALESLGAIGEDERQPEQVRNNAVSALIALGGLAAAAHLTQRMMEATHASSPFPNLLAGLSMLEQGLDAVRHAVWKIPDQGLSLKALDVWEILFSDFYGRFMRLKMIPGLQREGGMGNRMLAILGLAPVSEVREIYFYEELRSQIDRIGYASIEFDIEEDISRTIQTAYEEVQDPLWRRAIIEWLFARIEKLSPRFSDYTCGRFQLNLVAALQDAGDVEEAKNQLRQTISFLRRVEDEGDRYDLHLEIFREGLKLEDSGFALDHLKEATALARKRGAPARIGLNGDEIYQELAEAWLHVSEPQEALVWARKAVRSRSREFTDESEELIDLMKRIETKLAE